MIALIAYLLLSLEREAVGEGTYHCPCCVKTTQFLMVNCVTYLPSIVNPLLDWVHLHEKHKVTRW